MSNFISRIKSSTVIERIRTNSIMNSLLWLCALASLTMIPSLAFLDDICKKVLLSLIVFLFLFAIFIYCFWMFKDPDRLQSEEYQLAHQKLLQESKDEGEILEEIQKKDHEPKLIRQGDIDQPDDYLSQSGFHELQNHNSEGI